jgi:glycosyltransferase involved in cell wall biosynthesis
VVSYLTEELVRLGHDVTLFASGDSITAARLVPCCDEALRLGGQSIDPIARHVLQMERVLAMAEAGQFDLIHWHIDYLHFPLSRRLGVPQVTTLHGRLDLPDLPDLYTAFGDMPVVSISDAQRLPLPMARWVGTVYHGLPGSLYEGREGEGAYLAFLGRIAREKRPDRAIEIARRTGMPLKIAAKVDKADRDYIEQEIRPLLDDPLVEFIGEIGDAEKQEFLGNARALLFPIDWPEPFGMVMIEAMACGTPVVAFRCGSVPEVIANGVNGFVVDDLDGACRAVESLHWIDRKAVRSTFEQRFSVRRMGLDYVALYDRLTRVDPFAPPAAPMPVVTGNASLAVDVA